MEGKKRVLMLSFILLLVSFITSIVVQQANAAAVAVSTGDTPKECGERGGRWIAGRGAMDREGFCEESDPGNDGCPPSTKPKWIEEAMHCIPAEGREAKDDWCLENGWGPYAPDSGRCSEEDIPFEECMEKCFMTFPGFEEPECIELCGGVFDKCTPEIIAICEEQEMMCDPETGECINIPR
jgi:hypothetical protein